MQWAQKQKGFTIVELLIVIVVIAILAAVTIAAFTGVQNRARQSALQSDLNQAVKKISLSAIDSNELYPADKSSFLAAANLLDSSTRIYDYLASDDRKSYCSSVTSTETSPNTSFARTQSSQDAVSGRCIQNLVLNTGAESGTGGMNAAYGQGGVGTALQNATTPFSGSSMYRVTWSTAPTNFTTGGLWAVTNSATGLNAGGRAYTAYGYIRTSWAGALFGLNLVGRTSGGVVTGEVYGTATSIPNGQWTRVSVTWTAPASTDYFEVRIRQSGGALPVVGSTMDVDGFMLTEGSAIYSFGGIGSPNWGSKTGSSSSISFGPAMLQ
ncbi:MAG: type II secretion system protein [Candidatus Saccharimonadota bacterium]